MFSTFSVHNFALLAVASSLVEYHVSEVLMVYLFEPEELDWSSALLSPPYLLAMFFGFTEYFVSWKLFPAVKAPLVKLLCPFGLILVLVGEYLRKAAPPSRIVLRFSSGGSMRS